MALLKKIVWICLVFIAFSCMKNFRLSLKICAQFQAFKNLYPTKNIGKFEKIENKEVSVSEKKSFGPNSNTEIGPCFFGSQYQNLVLVTH